MCIWGPREGNSRNELRHQRVGTGLEKLLVYKVRIIKPEKFHSGFWRWRCMWHELVFWNWGNWNLWTPWVNCHTKTQWFHILLVVEGTCIIFTSSSTHSLLTLDPSREERSLFLLENTACFCWLGSGLHPGRASQHKRCFMIVWSGNCGQWVSHDFFLLLP